MQIMEATISKEQAEYLERVRRLHEAEDRGERLSLWDRAQILGPVLELVPGFSFDSDSKVKLYD